MRGERETTIYRGAMLDNLNAPRNIRKGDWRTLSPAKLLWLGLVEWFELCAAVLWLARAEIRYERRGDARSLADLVDAREAVKDEAADVGNFALFTATNCGAIGREK